MIEFFRGDTQPLKFQITYTDGSYPALSDISTLILTCRKFNNSESPILFTKTKTDFTFSDDYFHVIIQPEDTEELNYGIYNFDIECTMTIDSQVYRKTLKSEFKLKMEDTFHTSGGA